MRGRDRQQSAQQEAVRSRHGSSRSQTTHHDGKSVRIVSTFPLDFAYERVNTFCIARSLVRVEKQIQDCNLLSRSLGRTPTAAPLALLRFHLGIAPTLAIAAAAGLAVRLIA